MNTHASMSAPDTRTLPAPAHAPHVAGIVAFFESLSPESLMRLPEFYDAQARFTDPFNDVVGGAAIEKIFAHMFVTLKQPHFVVTQQVVQGAQCFLTWEFRFYFRSYKPAQAQVILGASHLVLNDSGLITVHRDYWDAAQELYEKLPVVGGLMRWLRAQLAS
jgi:hypothetical protein